MAIIGLPTERKTEGKHFSKSLPLNYRIKADRMDAETIMDVDVETVVKSKIEKAKALIQAAIKANGKESSASELKVNFNLNINLDELI